MHYVSVFTRFTHSPIHRFTPLLLVFLILALLLPSLLYAAPQMADYCYLPPFVTDPNTTPNVMFVYEKGSEIKKGHIAIRTATAILTIIPLRRHTQVFLIHPQNIRTTRPQQRDGLKRQTVRQVRHRTHQMRIVFQEICLTGR